MKKNLLTLLVLVSVTLLCGCGNDKDNKAKELYRDELTKYYNEIYMTSVSINNIDTSVSGCEVVLLGYLETMDNSFQGLSNVETPEKYEPLKEISMLAYTSFNNANTIYHEIYSGVNFENFDEYRATEAYSYYNQSMQYLIQIGQSLVADEEANGNVPDITNDTPSASDNQSIPQFVEDNSSDNSDSSDDSLEDDSYTEEEEIFFFDEEYESDNYGM